MSPAPNRPVAQAAPLLAHAEASTATITLEPKKRDTIARPVALRV